MTDYILAIDVWEGALDIDEREIEAGGVKLIIIRLNSITGGLRMDRNFLVQWDQAANFLRFPYYVYTPWETPEANFSFLMAYMPAGCSRVGIDIEVKRAGVSPSLYAANIRKFLRLVREAGLRPANYTGGWFLDTLSEWPTDVDYWWARYPYYLYPPQREYLTWDQLQRKLEILRWVPGNNAPGPVKLWQCSADRYVLPGTANRPMDINVWPGTIEELTLWVMGEAPVIETVPLGEWAGKVDLWARGAGYRGPAPEVG